MGGNQKSRWEGRQEKKRGLLGLDSGEEWGISEGKYQGSEVVNLKLNNYLVTLLNECVCACAYSRVGLL